ncbi:hypothetical protein [Luteimonas sp. FCS-9]|uniref:hypothetical protein n=1 Tax=Luteimonas sp. FCS-9 TaxID=1547516 RepID=UPI0012E07B13|nr:hypothetical protein [Luteimonas sp. FCS-9]
MHALLLLVAPFARSLAAPAGCRDDKADIGPRLGVVPGGALALLCGLPDGTSAQRIFLQSQN